MDNGWEEYGKMVLAQIKDLKTAVEKIDSKLDRHAVEIATVKTQVRERSLIYGAGAAAIVTIAAQVIGAMVK